MTRKTARRSAESSASTETLPDVSESAVRELAQVFKLLSDETRLRILFYLAQNGELHVTDLTLTIGVGRTTLTLPREGQVRADISGGVGEAIIRIPSGVAVRLRLDTGIGNVRVPTGLHKQGNLYVSEGYETAANRVDLVVSAGVGEITIAQADK